MATPREVQARRRGGRRGREPAEAGGEGLGGEPRAGEVHAGEEHQRRLHELAERLRLGRVAGLPRDEVGELVDVVGGAGGQQRHAERVRPLLLVVLATEHRGVGERVPEHDPLGEVVLRGRLLGEVRREHRITGEEHAGHAGALELGDHVAGVLLRGGEVERVGHGHGRLHLVRRQPLLEVLHALRERPRVVVVVDDAEQAHLRRQVRRPRVHRLLARQLRADERGPVLARLLGGRGGRPHVGRVLIEERLRLGDDAVADAEHAPGGELVGVRGGLARTTERRERVHLGRDLDRVGLGGDVVVGRAARLHRYQLHLAAVELVVRREVVDVLLRGLALLGQALVAPGLLEERLLQEVGLGLVQRDGDGVLGDARCGRAAVVAALPRLRRTAGRSRSAPPPCRWWCRSSGPSRPCLPCGLRLVEGQRPLAVHTAPAPAGFASANDGGGHEQAGQGTRGPAGGSHRGASSRAGTGRSGQRAEVRPARPRGRRARCPEGPTATTRPRSRATSRSATVASTPRSCSMTSSLAPSVSRTSRSIGAECLGFSLRDPARRLVEEQHRRLVREDAREVDDPAGTGRELVARTCRRTSPSPSSSTSSSTRACTAASERGPRGGAAAAATGLRTAHRPFARHRDGLAHGERREETTVLERPPEPEPRTAVGARAPSARPPAPSWRSTIEPASGRNEAGDRRRTAWSCPHRSGPTTPTISPACDRQRHVVERDHAAEAAPDPGELEPRRAGRAGAPSGCGGDALAAAAPRNTARTSSGWSSSPAVGPA